MDDPVTASERVPLTFGQRARLVGDCLPLVSLLIMVAVFLVVWVPLVGQPPHPAFSLFLAVVVLVLGHQALGAIRDLLSGVALALEDTIEWSGRTSRHGPARYGGRLAELGRVRMMFPAHADAVHGRRHRLVYSPASKTVWSAQPLTGWRDRVRP